MIPDHLLGLLAGIETPRVLIVGDLMIDRYVHGEVSRISPEAPIAVLAARSADEKLGGAGNVAWNLRAMGADVDLLGVIGTDGWGTNLRKLLKDAGVDVDGLVTDPTRPTALKTRMMSGVQQMLRIDWEDTSPVLGDAQAALLERVAKLVGRADAVVLSDYGKGVLTPEVLQAVIGAARERKLPVLVDPKGTDYARYRGATLMTPNRKEAEQALGRKLPDLAAVEDGARELIEIASMDATLITLGSEGIYYRAADGTAGHDPAQARAVFDVTGAGDTVVAHLALYLAAGLSLGDSVALANQAAGIVVARLGTNAVTREELRARLRENQPKMGKVLETEDQLQAQLEQWRSESRRIVFTNGCFDIIHKGHVDYLRFARSKGDVLLVGVNDDASVTRLKGASRPVNEIGDRMTVLAAMEMVDAVTSFGEDTPKEIIERVTPNVLVKGEDWADKGVVGREWVEQHGGQVHLAPLVPGRSTTKILERARQNANE